MAKFSFRKIRDEEAPIIHQEWDIHVAPDLSKNIPDDGIEKKLARFILDWGNSFAHKALVVSFVFFSPECPNKWVFDLSNNLRAKLRIGEKPVHAKESGVTAIEKSGD